MLGEKHNDGNIKWQRKPSNETGRPDGWMVKVAFLKRQPKKYHKHKEKN